MADLDQLFEKLDRLDTALSWQDVKRRQPGPPPSDPERLRKILIAALALAVAAAGIFLALRAFVFAQGRPASLPLPSATSDVRPSPSPPPRGWVRHTDEAGVSIDTPADWTFNNDPVPALVEPAMLFAVGTGPVPTGGDCAPSPAIDGMPPDGALFVLQEYGSVQVPETGQHQPYEFRSRPDHFDLGPLLGPFECFGVEAHDVLFQDGGRFFQVFAMFGPDAPDSLRQEVEQSLDTLSVDPRPEDAQPLAECQAGKWTACPEAAWVYQVINEGQVSYLGHRGDEAILGIVGKRSFAIWTTSSLEDLPSVGCSSVADIRVCEVGDRLVWEAQGLLVWIEPAPSPYDSLRSTPGLPAGAGLERLVRASQRVRLAQP